MSEKWLVETAQKALVDYYISEIEKYKKTGVDRRIYIFGAGVRGTLFGFLLEENGITAFEYIDNEEQKWYGKVGGHRIIPLCDIVGEDFFIFIPIEHGEEIIRQLKNAGIKAECYKWLHYGGYGKIIEKLKASKNNEILVFGETQMDEIPLDEMDAPSLSELIEERYGKDRTTVIGINSSSFSTFDYLFSGMIGDMNSLKELIVFLNYETMTPFHNILPRTQQPELWEAISSYFNDDSEETREQINQRRKQAGDYSVEMKYSPRRVGEKAESTLIQKEYLKIAHTSGYEFDFDELISLEGILKTARKFEVRTNICFFPINSELGNLYTDGEFEKNISLRKDYIIGKLFQYCDNIIDCSKELKNKDFVSVVTIADAIRFSGRKTVVDMLPDL